MNTQMVLIIDDEEEIRDLLIKYLEREGIVGIPCSNGAEALKIMQNTNVNLILLDIMMEDMDGFEVLRHIRNMDTEIPVIYLSAREEEYDKVLGLGLGADDYVTKPFSPGELMARVKAHLRRQVSRKKQAQRILQHKELKMDINSYLVTIGNKRVELVGKELLLLKFFMENPNRVFTKSQIYHQVWDEMFEDDNTVMVYISRLREKIEENPRAPKWIQTIRGIGYRFGGE
ncbi:response regulator transcription factor [Anaerosacchariphilus polymeriproducens]|uniref:Stage 0 sporulation protein A homolog n=1 Tax=Anaerosacchariphilus polymeriproducens TaxID=1812858 RepID=A0A371ARN0_9FIRM|nr:response regulator transcription factor [Anaerosacchariphilus polymeriproducens]RDU22233.1 DNA-binding response regulator [Anaerosacchariphilus polymeriproducens]